MKRNIPFFLSFLLLFLSCSKVPVTNRKQFKLLPNSTINSLALSSYKEFLSQNTLSNNVAQTEQVKQVGDKIATGVKRLFRATGKSKLLAGYKWEFNLVQDPTVNAWCMPGGKVVVYSGLMPVALDDDGLAVVMGHEIAHAIANHGNERMSQGLAAQLGGVALSVAIAEKPEETQALFLNAYGIGAQLGVLLPFSRLHESEADEIGLCLMAIAGYDPEKAVGFWERMDRIGGAAPPEFLSTHPSHNTRIQRIRAAIPKAKSFAKKYGQQL